MNERILEIAESEAKRFLEKCEELRKAQNSGCYSKKYFFQSGNKHTANVKRSSMDLSRALADVRKTDRQLTDIF
jgi:hypothetical protein